MANFELKRLPLKAGRQLKALADEGLLDRKENLLVFGALAKAAYCALCPTN
jgi:hypothetical protein